MINYLYVLRKKMQRIVFMNIYSLTCLFLFLYGTSWAAKKDIDPKKAIATVNGTTITQGELEEAYSQNLLFVSHKKVTRQSVLNNLINRILGIERARKGRLENNPVVKKKMEDVLYHAQISKELEPLLKKIKITDKDIQNYYKNNPEYRTANILLRVRPKPEEKEWQAALLQAKKIYVAVKQNPKKFPEYAKKYGQSTSAPQGGELGFQPAVRMAPEYFRAIKGKKIGYISPPVRSQYGYHIIKVLGVRDFSSINKAAYKKITYDAKRDYVLEQHFKKMRKNAKITLKTKLD